MARTSFESFGRVFAPAPRLEAAEQALAELAGAAPGSFLPAGNGKSYGDSGLNHAGTLADMRASNRFIAFDPQTGMLDAEPGVLLCDVIDHVAPHGFFLPVTPGTRFVTLGGAVANDVHGKNHHRRGTFGAHVEAMTLVRSDGVHLVDRNNRPDLFAATIGGMGLTGIITHVRMRMMPVTSPDVLETRHPFTTLAGYFDMAEAADAANEYAVAWLDQIHGGRGILMTANHAPDGVFEPVTHRAKLSVPFDLPFAAINGLSLRLFNMAFHAAKSRGAGMPKRASWQSYFYPLDAVGNWNRLYGPRGLFQHQSVIPEDAAREAVPALLDASHRAGQASFLTVLKRFGDVPSPGLMSFAMPGYTLTLDFPNRGASTLALMAELDAITVAAGGRVNPYKDARMSPATFAASFPRWRQLEALRDPVILSDFWRRTALSPEMSGMAQIDTTGFSKSEARPAIASGGDLQHQAGGQG